MGEGQARRPIVLCADDYGLNDGVTSAILDLAARGRISATSCMTNAPGWPEAAARLKPFAGRIGIGLHLTLTWGAPLGPLPHLAPDGRLPSLGGLARRVFTGRLPGREVGQEVGEEVGEEIGRQLDAFSAALGREPDFVDGHQHAHVLPVVRGALLAALGRRRLHGRPWIRDPADRPAAILARRLAAPKALVVALLARGFGEAVRRAGFGTNRGFSGFSPFDPTRPVGPDMARFLSRLGASPLVMCHPGGPGGDPGGDAIAAARIAEYAYLGSPDFASLLDREGLVLSPAPAR